jgi:hypothetical protein
MKGLPSIIIKTSPLAYQLNNLSAMGGSSFYFFIQKTKLDFPITDDKERLWMCFLLNFYWKKPACPITVQNFTVNSVTKPECYEEESSLSRKATQGFAPEGWNHWSQSNARCHHWQEL